MTQRKQAKKEDVAMLLTRCHRRCCLCYGLEEDKQIKTGQIAHIDQNSSNSKLSNLVWLCLDHHNEYDSVTSQSKNITKEELIIYKKKLEFFYAESMFDYDGEPLVLIDSFPQASQLIEFSDLDKFFLKFNKPVDRESARVIRNHYMRLDTDVQWTSGGWIQYKDDDSRLLWHPNPEEIERIKREALKARVGEHTFELKIGTNKGNMVKGKDGSEIEPTLMEVSVKLNTEKFVDTPETLTRAEFVKDAILEIDGLAGYERPSLPTFLDVPDTHWYYDFIESAVQLGIICGYTTKEGLLTGLFGPDDIADRAWATKVLVNTFAIPTTLLPISPFVDVKTGHVYHDYVLTAYNQSIVEQFSVGKFCPDDPVARTLIKEWFTRAKTPAIRMN